MTLRKAARRVGLVVAVAFACFVAAVVVTARPGDPSLWPAPEGVPAVEIFVVNHGYHSGIVIARAALLDAPGGRARASLVAVANRFAGFQWLEIGWGDEGFYTQVPTLSALTVEMALRALFHPGNPSVLHVVGIADADPRPAFTGLEAVPIRLGEAGFGRLLDRLDTTFRPDEESHRPEVLGPGLYGASLFFRANGAFSILNVCNHWVAGLLDAAGIPTAPVLATLPDGLLLDLKWRSGLSPLVRRDL
jgi:uncharacterized protein (TIGR02117 family)